MPDSILYIVGIDAFVYFELTHTVSKAPGIVVSNPPLPVMGLSPWLSRNVCIEVCDGVLESTGLK